MTTLRPHDHPTINTVRLHLGITLEQLAQKRDLDRDQVLPADSVGIGVAAAIDRVLALFARAGAACPHNDSAGLQCVTIGDVCTIPTIPLTNERGVEKHAKAVSIFCPRMTSERIHRAWWMGATGVKASSACMIEDHDLGRRADHS